MGVFPVTGWAKKAGAMLLLAMLLSLQLIAAPQAMAMSTNNASVTFRRAVVAWYDDKGKLEMNVTCVNNTIDFANLTDHNSSSCASNLTANLNVSVVTLYNMTEKHEQLLFFGITIYNETFNYTMYALVYRAERSQYNFTLVTRIFTDPETGEDLVFATAINIAPREDRALPVGDTIVTRDNLTLSEHYWTLNKVLMKLRRGDETNWIWGRSAYELRHLSHLVRLKLPEYNQEKAVGMTTVIDEDESFWRCVVFCLLESALPIVGDIVNLCLTGPCYIAILVPNPYTVAACAACLGIGTAVCAVKCALGF